MENKARLLEFTTRLVYSVDGLSSRLKVYWSHVLSVVFSDSLQESQIQFNESQAATKRFKSNAGAIEFAKTLSRDELIYSLGLVSTLAEKAEQLNESLEAKQVRELIIVVTKGTERISEEENIRLAQVAIRTQLDRFEKRPLVKISARIWPIFLDYFIRWITLATFNIVGWGYHSVIGINTVAIPVVVLVVVAIISNLDKRHNRTLLQKYGGAKQFKLTSQVSTDQYTILAFFIGSGVLVNYLILDMAEGGWVVGFLTLVGFMIYYSVCLRFFAVGRIDERDLASQVGLANSQKKEWGSDENDEAIVTLETRLNSVTSRLEAYVVESALFGALSFSGFLQIIANNIVSLKDMDRFADELKRTALAIVYFDVTGFAAGFNELNSDKSLFCLVSVETLLCSIFFLAVIASRLQFSDVADKIREALNLAKAYNEKEESIIDSESLTEKAGDRLKELNKKIGQQLERAAETTEELRPVIRYMQYFRNAGIIVFLVLLVNSSLFITGALGWAFTVLGLATWMYFRREAIGRRWQSIYLQTKILFAKGGNWLLLFGAVTIVLAYVLRIGLDWDHTDYLRFLGIVVVGVYFFTWVVFTSHFDAKFGEIDPAVEGRSGWRIAKNLFGPAFLMLAVGTGFKILHFTGANEMLMISLTSLSMLSYVLGYYLSKNKLLGIVASLGLSTTAIGILFKVFHFNGADEMLMIALYSAFPLCVVVIVWRKQFHKLFIQWCLVVVLANLYFASGSFLGQGGISRLFVTAYEHKTMNVSDVEQMIAEIQALRSDIDPIEKISILDSSVSTSDKYMERYGGRMGWTDAYRTVLVGYYILTNSILDTAEFDNFIPGDTLQVKQLEMARKAAHQMSKIESVFNKEFMLDRTGAELEADVLLKMGRREEAIEVLSRAIEPPQPADIRERLAKKLGVIKGAPPG